MNPCLNLRWVNYSCGIKDENRVLMATESTEEHGKIRSKNPLATEVHGSVAG